MNKKNTISLAATGIFLIIVGVLVQSFIRQKQADRVVSSIKESVARADNKQKALELAIKEHKDDIEFVRAHRPIIKIELQESKAYTCDDMLTLLIFAEALDTEDFTVFRPGILSMMNAMQCAL